MIKWLLSFVIVCLSLTAFAQTKPSAFTEETNPNNANFEFYSQKSDSSRRASFTNVKKNMVPDVNTSAIDYVPSESGNTLNKTQFVITRNDSIYYIDGYGDAFLLYDPTDTVLTGSISGDTLYLNNLELLLTAYRQTLDTLSYSSGILSASLSGDNIPAVTVDLSELIGVDSLKAGQLLQTTTDSVFLVSDTLSSDLTFITQSTSSGKLTIAPVASTYQLTFASDNNDVSIASLANGISVADTTINITISESGANTGDVIVTDGRRTTTGVVYAADYSAGFGSRSLVDKGYVQGIGQRDQLQSEVTSKVTATLYNILPCDATSGGFEINVPGSPVAGDWFAISDSRGIAGSNNITIDFVTAAVNLHGSSQNYIMNVNNDFVRFTYINSTIGWIKSN